MTQVPEREAGAGGLAKESLRAAALPFLASRCVVLVALLLAKLVAARPHASASQRSAARAGLLGWDATWYRQIAALGYGGAGRESLRFFPLLPLTARGLAVLPGVSDGTALLVVANLGALAAIGLIYRLVLLETGDRAAGHRATWLLALFPVAFVLVMGYAESLMLTFALACFLCLRTNRFALAGLTALLAGLCRPTGLLLALPAVVEGLRALKETTALDRLRRGLAVAGAPVGTAIYLAWSKAHDGSFLLPFREQVSSTNRGSVADPVATIGHDADDLAHLHHLGTALHAPWAIFLVALAVVVFRKWPVSYGAYAAATLVVALTAPNLTSLERYGLGCFPFVLALTSLTARPVLRWAVLAGSAALLVGYSVLTFLGIYVP